MSDARYRSIERQWLSTGSPEDFNALIAEGLRIGARQTVERIISGILDPYDVPFKTEPPHCSEPSVIFQVPVLSRNGGRAVSVFRLSDNASFVSTTENFVSNQNIKFLAMPAEPHKLLRLVPSRLAYDMGTIVKEVESAIQTYEPIDRLDQLSITSNSRSANNSYTSSREDYSFNPQAYSWNIVMRRVISTLHLQLNLVRSPFGDNFEMSIETPISYWNDDDANEVQGLRISGPRYAEYGLGIEDEDHPDYEAYEEADTWDWIPNLDAVKKLVWGYLETAEGFI